MKKLIIKLIRFYQKNISSQRPRCCRFYPTCSAYAIEAVEKRGLFVGLLLALYRILRCNPFCKGGYDPVPEKRNARKNESDVNNRDCYLLSQNYLVKVNNE